ncbi:Galactose/lactose metabolism regulatory protein GAL80 [Pseudocercospora fuligena]|uniref:Galactose/lactose metabolism regulatory protein GAL80 n=1 Tax=Pseudocercospora fuligena TaxID=685502 RepID=A0A8H6RLM0_9PEZI|nr:Galactose/lactose metabolism regulatory protein GAL80 [Pseudocercospora fuligena]
MAPIRIAFIGLSASRGWASNAHIPYLRQTTKYKIVGVCNSSKESSEAAIKKYELPSSTKAYGSPEELAEDSDSFDLAVCSVRVDLHYPTVKAIVAKGKQCYVEWPLGKNFQEAEELHNIAVKAGNARTMVGLQGRRAPVVLKVKDVIASGAIGKVLSVNVRSSGGNLAQVDPVSLKMFNDPEIGANMLSIHFGHLIDFVLYALGQELSSLSAALSTQRKNVQLKHPDGKLEDDVRRTPDQILLQGHLDDGAVLSVHQRGGSPFKDTPGLAWRIYGEKGEIEVTSDGSFLQVGYGDSMVIKLHDHDKDEVKTIDWEVKDGYEGYPGPAQNVARLYEAFADGRQEDYADWKQAVARHRLLEKLEESSKTGASVKL